MAGRFVRESSDVTVASGFVSSAFLSGTAPVIVTSGGT